MARLAQRRSMPARCNLAYWGCFAFFVAIFAYAYFINWR
jgi:hypothetical protein